MIFRQLLQSCRKAWGKQVGKIIFDGGSILMPGRTASYGSHQDGREDSFKNLNGYLILWLLLSLLMLWPLGCSSQKDPAANPSASVPVKVATAVQKTIPVQLEAIGTVEAYQTISVRSQITALITKVLFKEGQDVSKGALLFELDCRTNEAALRQAEANLIKDKAQAKNAEKQLNRYTELIEEQYVTREQFDQAQTNLAALEATVKADEAMLENNRIQIQYCSIYAPIAGRTGALKVDPGNIIKANDMEIVTINQIQPVNIAFTISEKDLAQVKKYLQSGKLNINAFIPGDELPEKGELTFVDNAIDKTTGTITLKGAFANREKRLLPGQFVDVVLILAADPNAILVPSQSIDQGQTGQYIYVVKSDSTVEMRPVTIGANVQKETVILKGIQPGEQVVTDGQLRLVPGAKVTITATK